MAQNKVLHIGPFRVDAKSKKLIEKAAKIDRRSVSDFIRLVAVDKAVEVIETDKAKR